MINVRSGRAPELWISLGLAGAVFAVYLQTASFPLIAYDDPEFVSNNIHLRGGLTAANLIWAFTTGYAGNWFPLTWLSYMLDGGRHLTNVALHAANSILVFIALLRMTGARGRSAFAALLFAVHPLHVETVAWISQRRELLSAFFSLLSIWAYAVFAGRAPVGTAILGRRPRRWIAYAALLPAFSCGLMSKPTIVTLPFALLLLDYWPLRRWGAVPARRLMLEKLPLFALAGAASVVTFLAQRHAGAIATLAEAPFPLRLENAPMSYVAYVVQFFWPARLAVIYPLSPDLALWEPIAAAAALIAVTAFAISARGRAPYFLTGWLWFLGALAPVIGLVQIGVQSRADRYMYMPLMALSLITIWGMAALARRRARLLVIAGLAACCVYAAAAAQATAYWRDTVTLFRHAVEVTCGNWPALLVLSRALLEEGRAGEAMPYISQALELRPNLPEAHINLGAALSKRGDFPAAAAQYGIALQSDPHNADAHEGLGVVLTEQGRYSAALPHLEFAVRAHPGDFDAHYNLGRLYGVAGQPALAIPQFAESVSIKPQNAEALFNLGTAYAAEDRFAEAAGSLREAVRLKPEYAAARFNLGSALANLGQWDEAAAEFQRVLAIQPDFPGASQALEECLAQKNRPH